MFGLIAINKDLHTFSSIAQFSLSLYFRTIFSFYSRSLLLFPSKVASSYNLFTLNEEAVLRYYLKPIIFFYFILSFLRPLSIISTTIFQFSLLNFIWPYEATAYLCVYLSAFEALFFSFQVIVLLYCIFTESPFLPKR